MDAQTIRRALYDFFRFNPKDFFVQSTGTGFLVSSTRRASNGTTAARRPLQPYDVSEEDTPKVSVEMGTFGGNNPETPGDEVPTIDGTRIDEIPPPALTLTEDDVLLYFHVEINDDGEVTAVSVLSTSDTDPPANDESNCYVRLATLVVTVIEDVAKVVVGTPNLSGSQDYEQCGVTHKYWLI